MTARESAAVERAVQDVLANGKSQADAARDCGVSYSTLIRAIRRRGIPPIGRRQNHEQRARSTAGELPDPYRFADGSPLLLDAPYFREDCEATVEAEPTRLEHQAPVSTSMAHPSEQTFRTVTPLLRFIRELNEYSLQIDSFVTALASTSGKPRTLTYLYQLAANPNPNPTLRLAHALVEQSNIFGKKFMIQPLTYEDLLIGAVDA